MVAPGVLIPDLARAEAGPGRLGRGPDSYSQPRQALASQSGQTCQHGAPHIECQLKRIDAEIARLLRSEETLKRRSEILSSIPGISSITAAGLITHMPELGTMTGPQAASLAGLAPVTRQSGTWKGRSFIQSGRDRVRRMLYMPALAAIRTNPALGRKYKALIAAAKPPKVAITAIMRKLLILANVLVQQDRLWTPEPPATA